MKFKLTVVLLILTVTIKAQDQTINGATFKSSGFVGIGTMNPLQKFQIGENGFTFHDGGHKVLTFNANTTNFGSIRYDVPNEKFNIETVVNGNSTTQMQIKSSGVVIINHNLGIGTSDLGSWKLAVNGQIRAKEIKVETDWSDFVFEETYKLPTLKEVEKHIKEKGHLKDIPSAKDVAKNGIYLGEMDSKLLQKIEELTLYTLQQEKKINEQTNEIKKIKELVFRLEKLLKNK